MKATLLIVLTATSFQVTSSFFGINVVYPLAMKMSSECLKASASIQNLPQKIIQILKVTTKFNNEEFDRASSSLTDLQHFFDGLLSFLQQYENFINESPNSSPLNIFSLLIYNAQLMESATTQIQSASETFSNIFGSNLKHPMELILNKYAEMVTVIRASLEVIQSNIESTLDADDAITVETLDAELDEQAITDTIRAFQELTIANKHMLLINTGLIEITKTLDAVAAGINLEVKNVKATLSKITYNLNIEVQSARTTIGDQIRANIRTIVSAFDAHSKMSLKTFSNVTAVEFLEFLKEQSFKIDDFSQEITDVLTSTQTDFTKQLQNYYALMYQSLQDAQITITNNAEDLINYLAQLIIEYGGSSFKNCFQQSGDVRRQAIELLEKMHSDYTACSISEQTLANQVESLLTFIVEDVTLNMQGAADKLCECSVKGGRRVQEQTSECLMKVTNDLHSKSISDDEIYLNSELDNIEAILERSETRFEYCYGNVSQTYEIAFAQFQQAALACIVST